MAEGNRGRCPHRAGVLHGREFRRHSRPSRNVQRARAAQGQGAGARSWNTACLFDQGVLCPVPRDLETRLRAGLIGRLWSCAGKLLRLHRWGILSARLRARCVQSCVAPIHTYGSCSSPSACADRLRLRSHQHTAALAPMRNEKLVAIASHTRRSRDSWHLSCEDLRAILAGLAPWVIAPC